MYTYDNILLNSSWNEKYFRQKVVEKNQITFYVQQLFLKNCAIYEIMWEKMVEQDRPQTTV
jgi:hypothetical protein